MTTPYEQLKAQMMDEMKAEVETLFKEGEKELTLTEIEELVLKAGRRIQARMTQAVLEQQGEKRGAELPCCGECGQRMQPKGKKHRYLRTRSGEVEIERGYYYCPHCRQGIFPPG
jgi:chromosome segregation and condensation protein ScpB